MFIKSVQRGGGGWEGRGPWGDLLSLLRVRLLSPFIPLLGSFYLERTQIDFRTAMIVFSTSISLWYSLPIPHPPLCSSCSLTRPDPWLPSLSPVSLKSQTRRSGIPTNNTGNGEEWGLLRELWRIKSVQSPPSEPCSIFFRFVMTSLAVVRSFPTRKNKIKGGKLTIKAACVFALTGLPLVSSHYNYLALEFTCILSLSFPTLVNSQYIFVFTVRFPSQ